MNPCSIMQNKILKTVTEVSVHFCSKEKYDEIKFDDDVAVMQTSLATLNSELDFLLNIKEAMFFPFFWGKLGCIIRLYSRYGLASSKALCPCVSVTFPVKRTVEK